MDYGLLTMDSFFPFAYIPQALADTHPFYAYQPYRWRPGGRFFE